MKVKEKTKEILEDALKNIGCKMLLAAQTAPKARGIDNLYMKLIYDKEIVCISDKMKEIGKREEVNFFLRDADNILKAPVVLLIGTKINTVGLKKCGLCGFKNCEEKKKHAHTPCAYNTIDLGIAIGSAVSIAADNRVDNRVMYTIGQAAIEMKLLGDDVGIILGIPLSATAKNPFFDR